MNGKVYITFKQVDKINNRKENSITPGKGKN